MEETLKMPTADSIVDSSTYLTAILSPSLQGTYRNPSIRQENHMQYK